MFLTPGTTFTLTQGEWSDYSILGHFTTQSPVDLTEAAKCFIAQHPPDAYVSVFDFVDYLESEGLILRTTQPTIHLGDSELGDWGCEIFQRYPEEPDV